MKFLTKFTFLLVLTINYVNAVNNKTFPKNFMFGTATAAYQIEGGWDADGKGPNIWDNLVHKDASYISSNGSGDIACDSYHKYKEDVAILKDLGVAHYRFSIGWSRVLPQGTINKVNEAGINYYKNLIKELKAANIEPLVTLHHWDLPQALEEAGGFLNENIVDWFADYARLCFESFGDSVKFWMTFNEPKQTCLGGYGEGMLAPSRHASGIGEYVCSHNVLKAHAKAYHIYDKQFRSTQKGKVSIVVDTDWYEPESNSTADKEAAEIKLLFTYGWYVHPIVFGDYPDIMKTKIGQRSTAQGFSRSRFPAFTPEEKLSIKGTYDFISLNSYTSRMVRAIAKPNTTIMGWDADAEAYHYQPSSWEATEQSFMKVTPWGMRKLLAWVSKTYGNPDIIITENGRNDNDGRLNDDHRIRFLQDYMSNVRDAMEFDGVKVFGYTVWSIMDNFEWQSGFTVKFGLYHVDFTSPNRTRTPKKSVGYYRNVIKTKCLVDKCES